MSVRPRTSPNRKGGRKVYVADYRDQNGKRHIKTFPTRPAAKEHESRVLLEVRNRTHIAPSTATTIRVAALCWIDRCKAENLGRATISQYMSHITYHIEPYFQGTKLITITSATVLQFKSWLRHNGRSDALAQKILTSLFAILSEAMAREMISRHPMVGMRKNRRSGEARKARLEIGVDVPSTNEIRRLIAVLPEMPFWQPVILTLVFTGLRASEARGLRWQDVDLTNKTINVRQRIDCHNEVGPPKSKAGTRTIPIPPELANILREWKLRCPRGSLGLAFPDKHGNPMRHEKLTRQGLHPALLRACLVTPDGKPKYSGAHHLRHFFCSYCLNRRADHGLELSPQIVQARMGHATFQMTVDLYGHLFRTNDDDGRLAAGESYLMGRLT